MSNLHRLVYTSARAKICDDGEIENILASCKRNNSHQDITGILIHTDKRFLQVLEGDKDAIVSLYDKIKVDARHGGVNMRSLTPISERNFAEWDMAYKDISNKDLTYTTDISEENKSIFKEMISSEDDDSFGDRGINVLRLFLEIS